MLLNIMKMKEIEREFIWSKDGVDSVIQWVEEIYCHFGFLS